MSEAQAFGAHLDAVFIAGTARRRVGAGAVYQAQLDLDQEFENFFIERYLAANPGTGEAAISGHGLTHEALRDQLKEKLQEEILDAKARLNDQLTTRLVSFDWTSSAPMSSSALLGLLDFGGARAYVFWARNNDTQQPWTAIAAVQPKNDPDVMSAVFALPPGSEYFLPTRIANFVPDLIRRDTVRKAVAANLEHAAEDPEYSQGLEWFLSVYGDPEETDQGLQRKAALKNYFAKAYLNKV